MIGEPRGKLGSKAGSHSRIQFTSNESKWVPKNLDFGPHLKWALIERQFFHGSLTDCICICVTKRVPIVKHSAPALTWEMKFLWYPCPALNQKISKHSKNPERAGSTDMKTDGSLILMFFKYPEPAFFGKIKEPYNTGFNTEYPQLGCPALP